MIMFVIFMILVIISTIALIWAFYDSPSYDLPMYTYREEAKDKNIWSQLNSLHFDNIDIAIDRYPLYGLYKFHIIITSKEGYGAYRFISSVDTATNLPIPEDELQYHISTAIKGFDEVKSHNNFIIKI